MKLAYQVSTSEVRKAPGVTAYQDDLAVSFRRLAEVGYDGAELMVADPGRIDVKLVKRLTRENRLAIPMVCTGEIFGQEKLSFSDPDDAIRSEAIRRVKDAINLAADFGGQVNIGRIRGGFVPGEPPEQSRRRALEGLLEICGHARPLGVTVALEPANTFVINFINSTADGLAILDEMGQDGLSIMLDTTHMFIEDPDIFAAVRLAAGRFTYVHLTDSNRKWPGNCKIDFAGFLQELRAVGYDGWLSVEVFQIPDQDTALEKSYAHIKPLST